MSFYAQLDGLPTVTEFEMAAGLIYVFVCFDCFEVTALLHRAVVEVFAVARERSRWRGIGTSGLQPGAGGATAAARVIPAWRRRQVRPGSRLSTVRQLARDLDVSPTTVARAYRELERDDLAYGAAARERSWRTIRSPRTSPSRCWRRTS